jgi:hypothetical protein
MTWKYTKILMYDLFIFYRKLIDAVKDEIYGERRQKIFYKVEDFLLGFVVVVTLLVDDNILC